MYAAALLLSGVTTVATTGLPFLSPWSLGPIQGFGIIVAVGVLIGAAILRRYSEWHGVADEHIRGLIGWITICGFIGAHVFDVLMYEWPKLMRDPLLILKLWDGISSYGGLLGGAAGFALYAWWKRLPVRLLADCAMVGFVPAFTIGRIGCTVVSDHVGSPVKDPDAWYAFVAMNYPRTEITSSFAHLFERQPKTVSHVLAWNLGLLEFLYLVPVTAIVLVLGFRASKRLPAGFVAVLSGVLYAPVRFFLDYMRPEGTDPRIAGLTFAQWVSILVFGVCVYVAAKILRNGKPADVIARTAGEAQAKLRVILKEDDEAEEKKPTEKEKSKTSKDA